MQRIRTTLQRAVFALAIAATLGFGATQATATARDETRDEPRVCDPRCKEECWGFGGELRHWGCLCCG